MKKMTNFSVLFLIGVSLFISLSGCGEKEKSQEELVVGNWMQLKNRAYILLITNPKGEWNSSVRIADVTSKIVSSKGTAKGTWHIEKGQVIFTVAESNVEEIWKKTSTVFYDIVALEDSLMQLKDEAGYVSVWKKTNTLKKSSAQADPAPIVTFGPIAVNLNKNRSNDKDRYLCLDINLILKELMPDQEIPLIHPRARDAATIFLSSLVFNDVKDFNRVKEQAKKLVDVLNPYMEGFIKEIAIEHVIVATEMDKVEEFMIEHTLVKQPPDAEAGAEAGKEEKTAKSE